MSESNLTFEQLENTIEVQLSVYMYINGNKRCYACGSNKDELNLYWHCHRGKHNPAEIFARCSNCANSNYIKLSIKDEIVYLSLINNIIR